VTSSLEHKEKELDAIHVEKKKIAANKTKQIHLKKNDAEKMVHFIVVFIRIELF
jgi:hypothetical protein